MMQVFYHLIRKIKTFLFKISLEDKLLFLEAFLLTGIMRFKILKKPFNELKKEMGTYNQESKEDAETSTYRYCNKIRWIVTTISGYTPWESLCLVQALTVQKILKKKNISTTLYLGVNKSNNEMKAHAWIRCGRMYITGGNGSGYATVAKFSNE